jgi:hypothetical protein
VILLIKLRADDQRLLAEGRLCPPYQSTPSHLSVEERSRMQTTLALRVFNAVCRVLNAYKTEEGKD